MKYSIISLMDFKKICTFTKFKVIGLTAEEAVCQYQTDKQGKGNPAKIVKPKDPELSGLRIPLYC